MCSKVCVHTFAIVGTKKDYSFSLGKKKEIKTGDFKPRQKQYHPSINIGKSEDKL